VPLSVYGGSGEKASSTSAVSDQNIDFEDVENDSFDNMFQIKKMTQKLNLLGNEL